MATWGGPTGRTEAIEAIDAALRSAPEDPSAPITIALTRLQLDFISFLLYQYGDVWEEEDEDEDED